MRDICVSSEFKINAFHFLESKDFPLLDYISWKDEKGNNCFHNFLLSKEVKVPLEIISKMIEIRSRSLLEESRTPQKKMFNYLYLQDSMEEKQNEKRDNFMIL